MKKFFKWLDRILFNNYYHNQRIIKERRIQRKKIAQSIKRTPISEWKKAGSYRVEVIDTGIEFEEEAPVIQVEQKKDIPWD